jgi:hypothetical protein
LIHAGVFTKNRFVHGAHARSLKRRAPDHYAQENRGDCCAND